MQKAHRVSATLVRHVADAVGHGRQASRLLGNAFIPQSYIEPLGSPSLTFRYLERCFSRPISEDYNILGPPQTSKFHTAHSENIHHNSDVTACCRRIRKAKFPNSNHGSPMHHKNISMVPEHSLVFAHDLLANHVY